ncbi:MAG: radical SAM protein [Theionarchaea archaeon]|nr:radical SAM protein [Theionarchaea archaeon]
MTDIPLHTMLSAPLVAYLEISGKCNLKCDHCFVGEKPEKELSLQEWKRVITECADMGIIALGFGGGEPLIQKDIIRILDHGASEGIKSMVVATNGTVLPQGMVPFLRKTEAAITLMISLDSHRREFHDALRGVKGTYDAVLKTIRTLRDAGIQPALSTVITKENYTDIEGMWELMKDMGIQRWFLERIQPIGSAKESSREWEPSIEEWNHTLTFLFEEVYGQDTILAFGDALRGIFWMFRKEPWFPRGLIRKSKYPKCEAGKTSLSITATGDVIPCVQWRKKLDSVKDTPLKKIWKENPFYTKLRALQVDDIEVCKECEEKAFCGGGCRGVAYDSSGSITAPNPFCPKLL